jgi:hypothetical protein
VDINGYHELTTGELAGRAQHGGKYFTRDLSSVFTVMSGHIGKNSFAEAVIRMGIAPIFS